LVGKKLPPASTERNDVLDQNMNALAWGSDSCATEWNMYFVNGYKFYTKAWGEGKMTINCGVHVKGVTSWG